MKTRILKLFLVLALAVVICLPAVAMATVLNFDDITTPVNGTADMPAGYGGFTWGSLTVLSNGFWQNNPYYKNTGVNFASNPNAVYFTGDRAVTNTGTTPFIFEGADLGVWLQYKIQQPYGAHSLTITGYNGSNVVGSQTINLSSLSAANPFAHMDVNWLVDKVDFNGTGGQYGNNFLVDNFKYAAAPVPLPPSALLMGTGLLGLVGLRRFRKS